MTEAKVNKLEVATSIRNFVRLSDDYFYRVQTKVMEMATFLIVITLDIPF